MFHAALFVMFAAQICFTNQYRLDRNDLNYEESLIEKDPIYVSMREFCEGRHIRLCSGNNLFKFFYDTLNQESNLAVTTTTTEALETTTEATSVNSETFSHGHKNVNVKEQVVEEEKVEREKLMKGKKLVKNIIHDFHQLFAI
jgi:hypothetical protein